LAEGLFRTQAVAILLDEIYSDLAFDGAAFASSMEFPQLRDRVICSTAGRRPMP
jgi:aspartate/methionine/tyrosine aminotransferase